MGPGKNNYQGLQLACASGFNSTDEERASWAKTAARINRTVSLPAGVWGRSKGATGQPGSMQGLPGPWNDRDRCGGAELGPTVGLSVKPSQQQLQPVATRFIQSTKHKNPRRVYFFFSLIHLAKKQAVASYATLYIYRSIQFDQSDAFVVTVGRCWPGSRWVRAASRMRCCTRSSASCSRWRSCVESEWRKPSACVVYVYVYHGSR